MASRITSSGITSSGGASQGEREKQVKSLEVDCSNGRLQWKELRPQLDILCLGQQLQDIEPGAIEEESVCERG
jgi:hypothetical protein